MQTGYPKFTQQTRGGLGLHPSCGSRPQEKLGAVCTGPSQAVPVASQRRPDSARSHAAEPVCRKVIPAPRSSPLRRVQDLELLSELSVASVTFIDS